MLITEMHRLLGQSKAIDTLYDALASGRVHHAWVFSGPRGVGKYTTALAFARLLLDPESTTGPDGRPHANPNSQTSRLIDAGTHPDLHIVRKELAADAQTAALRSRKLMSIPLDLLRERMLGGRTGDDRIHDAPAYRTAMLGHGKVFIIDEAELLEWQAQGAMLKTLEEPPPQTYMFLVTPEPDQLNQTILSRCQHLRFGRLDAGAMKAWFDQSELTLAAPERRWIEEFADGSPGIALLAAQYGFYHWQQALDPMLDQLGRGVFPAAMGSVLAELVDGFASAWVKSHKNASKDAANKDAAGHVFTLLASYARQRLAEAVESGSGASARPEVIDLIREAERQLDRNVNLKLVLENLVVQWAQVARLSEPGVAPGMLKR